MMNRFEQDLSHRLQDLANCNLHRVLRRVQSPQTPRIHVNGQSLLNFSSNDYLGLATHPAVCDAACQAVIQFGAGSGASRLICGSLGPHHDLEESLAQFKGTEAALSFSSGYAAALGTISALLGRQDVILIDRLVHASIVDAARLSRARLRVFPHRDLDALEHILQRLTRQTGTTSNTALPPRRRILIITESIFSMDGDVAPLRELVALKEHYGAWLMVDEAHATGLYGQFRRGLVDEFSLNSKVEIQMGTLGKALGAAGGFVCGSRTLIDFLVNRARSFIFSTAPVPAAAAAATRAIELVQSTEGKLLCDQLWACVDQARQGLARIGFDSPSSTSIDPGKSIDAIVAPTQSGHSPILPILLGQESHALRAADQLRQHGILLPAIRYPTVARNQARLRLTLSAAHSRQNIEHLLQVLTHVLTPPCPDRSHARPRQ
jgi:8-amino-7-oxononanoate synthase